MSTLSTVDTRASDLVSIASRNPPSSQQRYTWTSGLNGSNQDSQSRASRLTDLSNRYASAISSNTLSRALSDFRDSARRHHPTFHSVQSERTSLTGSSEMPSGGYRSSGSLDEYFDSEEQSLLADGAAFSVYSNLLTNGRYEDADMLTGYLASIVDTLPLIRSSRPSQLWSNLTSTAPPPRYSLYPDQTRSDALTGSQPSRKQRRERTISVPSTPSPSLSRINGRERSIRDTGSRDTSSWGDKIASSNGLIPSLNSRQSTPSGVSHPASRSIRRPTFEPISVIDVRRSYPTNDSSSIYELPMSSASIYELSTPSSSIYELPTPSTFRSTSSAPSTQSQNSVRSSRSSQGVYELYGSTPFERSELEGSSVPQRYELQGDTPDTIWSAPTSQSGQSRWSTKSGKEKWGKVKYALKRYWPESRPSSRSSSRNYLRKSGPQSSGLSNSYRKTSGTYGYGRSSHRSQSSVRKWGRKSTSGY